MCNGTWLPFYGPLLIVGSLPGTLRSPTFPSQPTLCCQPSRRFHQKLTSSKKTPMISLWESMPSSLNSAPPFVLLFQILELPFKNSPENPDEPASFHSTGEEAETPRGKTSIGFGATSVSLQSQRSLHCAMCPSFLFTVLQILWHLLPCGTLSFREFLGLIFSACLLDCEAGQRLSYLPLHPP